MAAVEAAEAVAARDYNEVFDIFLFRRSSSLRHPIPLLCSTTTSISSQHYSQHFHRHHYHYSAQRPASELVVFLAPLTRASLCLCPFCRAFPDQHAYADVDASTDAYPRDTHNRHTDTRTYIHTRECSLSECLFHYAHPEFRHFVSFSRSPSLSSFSVFLHLICCRSTSLYRFIPSLCLFPTLLSPREELWALAFLSLMLTLLLTATIIPCQRWRPCRWDLSYSSC